jgi:hypothetical protein
MRIKVPLAARLPFSCLVGFLFLISVQVATLIWTNTSGVDGNAAAIRVNPAHKVPEYFL